ncbi:cysteine desulfurase [Actinobacillus pleuropneumoniae]|nr:cysteine desulfurase [Actinobacillus pleuropneumoniae]
MKRIVSLKKKWQPKCLAYVRYATGLYNGFKDIEEVYVNGSMEEGKRVDSNLNISFNFV